MEDKIIYKGKTNKGNEIILRFPEMGDVTKLHKFINEISREKTFVRLQGEYLTLEEEEKFLKEKIERITKKKEVALYAFINDEIVGVTHIVLKEKVERHVGGFGLIVAKKYRREGIGKLLMEQILKDALKNLPELKIVELTVFANNLVAIKLYETFGFIKFGVLPKGILHKGKYINSISMYKEVRKV